VTRLGSDAFAETWQVAGPGKDYELRTLYRRTAGATGAAAGQHRAGEAA
jgi:hypothetical protein